MLFKHSLKQIISKPTSLHHKPYKNKPGFTIIELLVVIVVIGILAAITIISYAGVRDRAVTASIKSQLSDNAKTLELYKIENDSYPTSLDENNCPDAPISSTTHCLNKTSNSTLTYTGTTTTYELQITIDDISYRVTDDNAIEEVTQDAQTSSWQITAGYYHSCVLSPDNLVYCWGYNNYGQIGDGTTDTDRLIPTATSMEEGISDLYSKTVEQVDAGRYHTCALTNEGLVYCWGRNSSGQIGDDTESDRLIPTAVNMESGVSGLYSKTVQQVAADYSHTCALSTDGLVYCWGWGYYGQLGNGTKGTAADRSVPTAVSMEPGVSDLYGKTVQQIAIGHYHSCALDVDGLVYCWGYNTYGQVGDGFSDRQVPTAVNTESGVSDLYGKTVQQVTAGRVHNCALDIDGLVYCWGYNYNGELGDGTTNSRRYIPTVVSMAEGVSGLHGKITKQLVAGQYHTCALTTEGLVYCWGQNDYGQLGDGTSGTDCLVPTAVNMESGVSGLYGKTVQQVTAGEYYTCALTTDNSIYCWGDNENGQLGDGTIDDHLVPTAVTPQPW